MIVEDHTDNRFRGVVGINLLEQRNELDTAVPILGMGKNMSRVKIDAGQNGHGAMPDVLVVASHGRRFPRNRRQVRRCQSCLLYTSDAADERSSVDLGGRRIIQKKKKTRDRE